MIFPLLQFLKCLKTHALQNGTLREEKRNDENRSASKEVRCMVYQTSGIRLLSHL